MNHTDYAQVRLHEKWKKDPTTYVKPPGDPNAPRHATLVHSQGVKDELSYILFVDGKLVQERGSAAAEFLEMDPEPLRKATVHMKSRPGFHVYYKQGPYWYGIKEHFVSLADTICYIHTGLRVLIEYRFSVQSVKYFVMQGYETGGICAMGEQGKWRSAENLVALYGVNPTDCIYEEYPGYLPPSGPLIVLRPLYTKDWLTTKDEDRKDYDLQRRNLKHFGKLAPTKSE